MVGGAAILAGVLLFGGVAFVARRQDRRLTGPRRLEEADDVAVGVDIDVLAARS